MDSYAGPAPVGSAANRGSIYRSLRPPRMTTAGINEEKSQRFSRQPHGKHRSILAYRLRLDRRRRIVRNTKNRPKANRAMLEGSGTAGASTGGF